MADELNVQFEELWVQRKLQFGVTAEDDKQFDVEFKPLAFDMFSMGWNAAFKRAGEIFAMVEQTRKG